MTLAELYDDLATRAWHALAEVKARSRTGDEDTGHQFHGNQWTGGLGAKPKTIKAKTSKAGVHELLSSGHPFTKQELMEVCGIKSEKLLSDYLAMLKNPKYAGPKGALSIQQKDGHYFVAMPNGQPAPPLEKATATFTPHPMGSEYDPSPGETATLPDKGGQPDWGALNQATKPAGHDPSTQAAMANLMAAKPAETPAPVATPAEPYAAGVTALSGAHPGSMPKGEADAHYEKAMAAANVYMAHKIKSSDVKGGHEAVLTWKNQKAAAMAAWAQAVHGTTHVPKKQEMFKADAQLATDIAFGKGITEALAAWKTNTSLEKQGNFPPKAKATPATKAAAAAIPEAPIAEMDHAAPVQPIPYDTLVPATHTPIGPADFAAKDGAWSKGIGKALDDLEKESGSSAQINKKGVENALRERLKDKPNFQALVKRLGLAKDGYASLESKLIGAWAGSSGDGNPISVALQMAVRDAFSMPDSHIEKAALSALNAHGHDLDKLTSVAIQQLNPNMKALKPHEVQTARAALQEFVQAQYHETQDLLKKLGHDHVYLARGMKVKAQHDNAHGAANVKLQPASSFSTQYSTAKSFGGYGSVFLVKVPRQQVLSTFLTGFGCSGENEVVVLAHNSLKAYTVPAMGAGSAVSASTQVHEQVGGLAAAHAKAVAQIKAGQALQDKMKPAQKPAHAPTDTLHPDAGNYAEKHAALKKAVINAKSKALKAKQAAEKKFAGDPLKAAHAAKAAEEAKAAVQSLQSFMSQWKGK